MPTYKYRCDSCDLCFEEFHSMSETIDVCSKCGSSDVKKVLSNTINISKKKLHKKSKPGTLVNEYIEQVKGDLKEEKKAHLSKEYSPE
tara:strand:- start:2820 stop:3083 length:264 start_codon:yes stop_codon:yes gene_type:complete